MFAGELCLAPDPAREGCFLLLVKQINADIMRCQRIFYQFKQLLLPLVLINNQLCDHLRFLAHYFLPPTQRKSERTVIFPLCNFCPLAVAGMKLSGSCRNRSAFAVPRGGWPKHRGEPCLPRQRCVGRSLAGFIALLICSHAQ